MGGEELKAGVRDGPGRKLNQPDHTLVPKSVYPSLLMSSKIGTKIPKEDVHASPGTNSSQLQSISQPVM